MTAPSRTMAVLSALADSDEPLTLTRIAELTNIPRATLGRMLPALEEERAIHCDEAGRYSAALKVLGPGISLLAHRRVREVAFPNLVELSGAVGNEVSLGLYEYPEIVFVETVFVVGGRVSSRLVYSPKPLLESHTGRLLVAYASQTALAELFRGIAQLNELVADDEERLRTEIEQAGSVGYLAFDRNARTGSPAGISVPVFDRNERPVAGIVITRPTGMDEEFLNAALPKALDTARRVSAAMGSRRSASLGHI